MADWLLLRMPHAPEQSATWAVVDSRGNQVGPPQSGPLALAAPRAPGRRVCVLVPGSDVLLAEPDVPMKAGTKLQQVVPYALEEQLADDIDELHFAFGKRAGDSSRTPVAVVRRALMDEWLQTLRDSGIQPETMYADSDLLPQNPGQAVALLEEDLVIVRPPAGSPVVLPAEALGEALEIAQQATPEMSASGGRGLVLYTGAAEWHEHSPQVEALRERFDGIKIQLLTGGPLSLFAQQLPVASPINLLQGSYTPVTQGSVGWQAWRVAAILLGCLVGLHIVGKTAELGLLKRQEHTLDTSMSETFRRSMPGERYNAFDARRRMELRLAAAQNGIDSSGLLAALEALSQAKSVAPGAVVQALSFHQGALEMKLSAPDAASLDKMSQSLRGNGWDANLTSGTAVASGYEGRIQIRAH
ncbi:MAG TPA: type II secretion system protein GspL [Steroidobacteraceae bacterium]|nr:type II secretion system protein GspL [Steroidobacteraceae bacterium]